MRLTLVLTFCLSVFSLVYSQTPENPWSFDVGVNSVSVKDEDGSKLSLPTLSLSRYIFGKIYRGALYLAARVAHPQTADSGMTLFHRLKVCLWRESRTTARVMAGAAGL